MRFVGFDIRMVVRKAPPPLPRSLVLNLVCLRGGAYSVPAGTIGVIEDSTDDGRRHWVAWSTGGSSGPIADNDLSKLGPISVRLRPDA